VGVSAGNRYLLVVRIGPILFSLLDLVVAPAFALPHY
jgi:hypothetical protein